MTASIRVLPLLFVAATLSAQSSAPPRRAHHALAYDENSQRVLLTGGSTPLDGGNRFEFFNDLWQFDGSSWSALQPSGEKISGIRLVFDQRQKRMLSFGGYSGGSAVGDLRVLESGIWRTLERRGELAAAEPGFVCGLRNDRCVAFGGSRAAGEALGQTWLYDGSNWMQLQGAGPPARQGHAMVFDERRGRTLVFGGAGQRVAQQPPPTLGDTWEFDGQRWTARQVTGPSARSAAGVAYDSRRGLVILFGGISSDGFKGDTWSWDGNEWKKLSESGPEPRAMGYLAYDKRRDRVVLFGGRKGWPDGDLNDTWEWDGTTWRRAGG